ncbi:MAG: hypothetical protein PHN45_01980 [Methylococcales bacterium]|nr:hypothetical protein [Methylococcales bacterium]
MEDCIGWNASLYDQLEFKLQTERGDHLQSTQKNAAHVGQLMMPHCGLSEQDIHTVMTQANVDRDTAVGGLMLCYGDAINTILYLT